MSTDPDQLDERLRGAFGRQLDDTKARIGEPTAPPYDSAEVTGLDTKRINRVRILSAAAAVVLAAGAYALVSERSPTAPIDVGDDTATTFIFEPTTTESTAPSTTAVSDEAAPTSENATTSTDSDSGRSTTTGSAPTTTAPTTAAPTTAPPTTASPTTSGTQPAPADPVTSPGVENAVCPSGRRAQLELASLSYVGPNQGWDRLDDLVDEQDGPYYFEAWEPGYTESVTVRLELAEPVLANQIRVAQDPYTPVSGIITIEAFGQSFELELEGVDGWKVQTFQPTTLQSFTINRNAFESNIMEVIVCVSDS